MYQLISAGVVLCQNVFHLKGDETNIHDTTLQCPKIFFPTWEMARKFNLICRVALINNKYLLPGARKRFRGRGKPKQLITTINKLII